MARDTAIQRWCDSTFNRSTVGGSSATTPNDVLASIEKSAARASEGGAANGDNTELDPLDGRGIEGALENIIARFTDDLSELARIKLLPHAKTLYEQLHPETKHGGNREQQVAKPATWPSFATYIAQRSGISQRSVYSRLKTAEQLATLDEKAEHACYGNPIANQISLLVRVARLPKGGLQRDVVVIYDNGGPKKAQAELRKWEDEFGLAHKPASKPKPTQPVEPEIRVVEDNIVLGEVHVQEVAKIIQALNVSGIEECVPAIETLKMTSLSADQGGTLQTTIQELRALLATAETRTKNLEQELKLYRATPLGKLFQILGAKDIKGALEKARELARTDNPNLRVHQ